MPDKVKQILEKLSILALCATAFSIALPIRVNSVTSIAALAICSIYLIRAKALDTQIIKTPIFLLIIAQAVILLLGLTHSADLSQGFADIERYGYAILFPLLIFQMRNSGITSSKLIVAFSLGCITLVLYGIGCLFINASSMEAKSFWSLGHMNYTDPMGIHPTYLSLYVSFIIFFLAEIIRLNRYQFGRRKLLLVTASILLLIILLFFIRSQMSLLLFVMLGVLYVVIVLKRRAWLVTFVLFTVGLLAYLLDTERVSTFFDTYGKNVSSALDNRFQIWKGALEVIKESPIVGGGTGSEHQELNSAYIKIGYLEGQINSYNAHNQYLEFLVRNGPIELLVFLIILVYVFRLSLQSSSYLFLLFCMMISVNMLSESFLQLHKGVVFFYFFLSVFIFLPFEQEMPSGGSHKNP